MKKLLFILFFSTIYISNANACLNYYFSVDKDGNLHRADNILIPFNKNFNKELNVSKLHKLETKLKKEHSYQALSDYSICLMKLGKQKEALDILVGIYVHYPNDYKIASNLGTAYELNGQNDSALKYIKRGLQLNPSDHEGSEWVHVKVLETKLNLAKNTNYLRENTVLQLSESQKKDTVIRKQIIIQVRERFPFTPGPDAIMSNILIDLADCYSNTASVDYAKVLYQIAKTYYGDKSTIIDDKIKEMQKLINKYAAVKPERHDPNQPEAENKKITGLSYNQCIDNNDPNKYIVNWSSINLNVKSLLGLVDFTKADK